MPSSAWRRSAPAVRPEPSPIATAWCPGSRETEAMSDTGSHPPHWTAEHEALVERAKRVEEARLRNNACARARVILHEGPLGVVQTSKDFQIEKRRAAATGSPVAETFRTWLAWEDTARVARETRDAMYPPETEPLMRRLAAGDADAVDWALVFLEADPGCFRAGYLRERVLRYLARMIDRLTVDQKHRLRSVALAAIDDPWRPALYDAAERARRMGPFGQKFAAAMGPRLADIQQRQLPFAQRREFKWFCRLAGQLHDPALAHDLGARVQGEDLVVARRAGLMLGAIARKQEPAQQA